MHGTRSGGSRGREESTELNEDNASTAKRGKGDEESITYEMFCCGEPKKIPGISHCQK